MVTCVSGCGPRAGCCECGREYSCCIKEAGNLYCRFKVPLMPLVRSLWRLFLLRASVCLTSMVMNLEVPLTQNSHSSWVTAESFLCCGNKYCRQRAFGSYCATKDFCCTARSPMGLNTADAGRHQLLRSSWFLLYCVQPHGAEYCRCRPSSVTAQQLISAVLCAAPWGWVL